MAPQSENTGILTGKAFVVTKDTAPSSDFTIVIDKFLKENAHVQRSAHLVQYLSRCSDATGGYVTFSPQHYYLPMVIGQNQELPLYSFIETLDEVVDYDAMKEHLPFLSYAQMSGALSFLRRVAQFNVGNIDIDQAEDAAMAEDPGLLDEIRKSLADSETSRVLSFD